MQDGPGRRSLKAVALGWFVVTTRLDRLLARAFGHTPFALGGACERCAACCEAPSIRVSWLTWYLPNARRLFLAWQRWVNGFMLTSADRPSRVFTFRCTHFDASTRRCDSYASRPGMCRDYPRVLLYQADPELLPGCGYRPLRPGGRRLLEVLDAHALDPAQRERLKRKLHLE